MAFAPAGQEEAQIQQARELAAGDSYNYGGDGSDVSNPYLGVASDDTINQIQQAMKRDPLKTNIMGYQPTPLLTFDQPLLTFDEFNALRGTTLMDPYRRDPTGGGIANLLSNIFGKFDYRGQQDTRDDLERQYALYANPYGQALGNIDSMDVPAFKTSKDILLKDQDRLSKRPFDQGDKDKGTLRSGLQTGYGSLFDSPVGTPTLYGEVKAQDRPMSAGEMVARGMVGLSSPIVGIPASLLGRKDFTVEDSPTYDPKKDPNSKEFEGSRSFLGNVIDSLTGGAGTSVLKEGSDYIKSSEAGFNLNDLISGIFSTNKGTEAINEMKGSVDQTGTNVIPAPLTSDEFQFDYGYNPNTTPFLNKEGFLGDPNASTASEYLDNYRRGLQERGDQIQLEYLTSKGLL